MTFECLYCAQNKPTSESSLEHAIPQFLGGAQAPLQYKLHNVCSTCNNRLGLHVDASYAKSWFVTNALSQAARKYYCGPGQSQPLPLTCMGPVNIPGLQAITEDEVAEYWLGPSGEKILWLRTNDESMYWYTGGNPTHRKHSSTVYFLPVSDDPVRLQMGTEALIGTFKKTKARRIFGATVHGLPSDTPYPGFDLPTAIDDANTRAIRAAINSGPIRSRQWMNLKFDQRFICKIALAVGFSLFGQPYLATAQAAEAQMGLKLRPPTPPAVRGSPTLFNSLQVAQLVGYEGAVVIVVLRTGGAYVMTMTVDRDLPFVVELCPDTLRSEFIDPELGYSLVLVPQLRHCVELSVVDLLAHVTETVANPKLAAMDLQRQAAAAFWCSLPATTATMNCTPTESRPGTPCDDHGP